MTVNTKHVEGRRIIHYDNFDELLADVDRLTAGRVQTLGNWSLGQNLAHLAKAYECSIDGFPFLMSAPFRFVLGMLMKRRFLNNPLPTGFQLPKKAADLIPAEIDSFEASKLLAKAVERLKIENQRSPHPALGKLTIDEWNALHLRHAELHLGFVLPIEQD